jgi:4-alpha-glucanotransferase
MQNKDSKIYFVFGIHNHQPVGNLSSVFDKAFSSCYLPFLSTLEKFPNLKAVIHNSGALYSFAQIYFPDWIKKLKKLTGRGQVEIVGGGYYEPIFPIIPQKDRVGQIKLMSQYLKKTLGISPKGCWVPERVWEPSLAKTLNKAGFNYTYLDQANFYLKKQNSKAEKSFYLTEDQGYPLSLFVIDELLADKIPFIRPEEAIDMLISYKQKEDVLVNFFCDGEKFGFWPGSYDLVYNKGWLEDFFNLLEKNPEIEVITSQEAVKKFAKKDLTYIEASTYPKMQKWALNYQDRLNCQSLIDLLKENKSYQNYRQFIKGENFKNFFIKYPRLNFMHKRMLYLAKKINSNLDYNNKNKEAFLNLWKAQTNCAYWHGIFGGFYLPHLRKACYDYLIKGEDCLDKEIGIDKLVCEDIDFDSYKEVIAKKEDKIYIFSKLGGSLEELSLKNIPTNLINTINRVKEPYHDKIKDDNLSKYLIYDSYKKVCLVDHLIKKDLTSEEFAKGTGVYSLANKAYKFLKKDDLNFNFSYEEKDLSFVKNIQLDKEGLEAKYSFQNNPLNNLGFGIEFNLSLSGLDNLFIEQDSGQNSSFMVGDRSYSIKLKFSFNQAKVYTNPIYTLSSSESGKEVLFQQLAILFYWPAKLNSLSLKVGIENL